MKLYLSSFKIGNFPEKLMGLFDKDKPKIAVVMNAMDASSSRQKWLDYNYESLNNLGFEVEELDLREYFEKKITEEDLLKYDGLWINGGNVFVLQRAFEQSGLVAVLPKLVKEEKLVYAGFSAALYVICPTLKGSDLVDNPDKVPEGYEPEFSWGGLGLIDKPISVHYKSDHPESADIDNEIKYFEENNIDYEVLRDGEVYYEDGAQKDFLRI